MLTLVDYFALISTDNILSFNVRHMLVKQQQLAPKVTSGCIPLLVHTSRHPTSYNPAHHRGLTSRFNQIIFILHSSHSLLLGRCMFIVRSVLCSSNQIHLIEQGGETALLFTKIFRLKIPEDVKVLT